MFQQPLAVDHILGEVVVSECVQRPGRGIHAGLTPECNNVNGVRRPCTVLGALENARGRTGLAATIPLPSTPCFTYPAIAWPAPPWGHSSRGQGSRNDGRSPRQADGPAPSSNVHQQALIPASVFFSECSGILCINPAKAESLAVVRHKIGETATSGSPAVMMAIH